MVELKECRYREVVVMFERSDLLTVKNGPDVVLRRLSKGT